MGPHEPWIKRYQPPKIGEADHADPYFKPRLRECGRCSKPFETTPRWRYFCEKCRKSHGVLKGLRVEYGIPGARAGRASTT